MTGARRDRYALLNGMNRAAGHPSDRFEQVKSSTPEGKTSPGSRQGTKAITVHFPEEVRRTLKSLAADKGRNMDDMVAEALNMLFAKYGKAETAPRKSG